jgi:hypothetical protein
VPPVHPHRTSTRAASTADQTTPKRTSAVPIPVTDSNFYQPATGAFVRDAIPSAELLVYEGADDSPHVGQLDRFAADLARFATARAAR